MRVSILVMLSVVSMVMCQGGRVPFRDSIMGAMLSGGVQSTRSGMGSLMGIMSTIGSGMRKIVAPGGGSRRQNGRPRGGNSGAPNLSSGQANDFVGPNGGLDGPNSQNGPRQQRRRPQRQQRRRPQQPQQEAKFEPQLNDGVQRLSGAEINGFASSPSSSHFKVRQQPRLRLQNQPTRN